MFSCWVVCVVGGCIVGVGAPFFGLISVSLCVIIGLSWLVGLVSFRFVVGSFMCVALVVVSGFFFSGAFVILGLVCVFVISYVISAGC